ncbi:hypothetical protein BHM03_00010520 [Ensete ventricosum]|uniref:Uncharacterized protein n=1 Tax=Ensete ventricosum TaxID=4639 RepID=A0A445MCY3_ENSVE|nr:hypothetical protein BHM03_00010520 [Ensete ventricosum]
MNRKRGVGISSIALLGIKQGEEAETIPTMSFSVAKVAPELIVPSKATPTGNLPLSFMDRLPTMRFMVDSIHVYSHGEEPAELIRGALSKALVPYYPMAGRFAMSGGELEVACTGEGIWFVEASADFSLEDVNNLQLPLAVPKEDILPYFPPEDIKDVIMLMQVNALLLSKHGLSLVLDRSLALRVLTVVD